MVQSINVELVFPIHFSSFVEVDSRENTNKGKLSSHPAWFWDEVRTEKVHYRHAQQQ